MGRRVGDAVGCTGHQDECQDQDGWKCAMLIIAPGCFDRKNERDSEHSTTTVATDLTDVALWQRLVALSLCFNEMNE